MQGSKSRSAKEQHTDDKLDSLIESMREVTSGIKEINRKLDDHGIAIAKHTEQIATLFSRIDRLERNCDMHRGVGSRTGRRWRLSPPLYSLSSTRSAAFSASCRP